MTKKGLRRTFLYGIVRVYIFTTSLSVLKTKHELYFVRVVTCVLCRKGSTLLVMYIVITWQVYVLWAYYLVKC